MRRGSPSQLNCPFPTRALTSPVVVPLEEPPGSWPLSPQDPLLAVWPFPVLPLRPLSLLVVFLVILKDLCLPALNPGMLLLLALCLVLAVCWTLLRSLQGQSEAQRDESVVPGRRVSGRVRSWPKGLVLLTALLLLWRLGPGSTLLQKLRGPSVQPFSRARLPTSEPLAIWPRAPVFPKGSPPNWRPEPTWKQRLLFAH